MPILQSPPITHVPQDLSCDNPCLQDNTSNNLPHVPQDLSCDNPCLQDNTSNNLPHVPQDLSCDNTCLQDKSCSTFSEKPHSSLSVLPDGVFAITGLCKNAGKTSLLNHLLAANQEQGKQNRILGVLTTGRDGEAKDTVFGNQKPAVRLMPQTIFCTTSEAIHKLGSAITILEKLSWSAAQQRLWLAQAKIELTTEIHGPASVSAQVDTARIMQKKGAEIVFIDGSLDRKSIVIHPLVQGVFIVAGSSFGSTEKIIDELQLLKSLAEIPVFPLPVEQDADPADKNMPSRVTALQLPVEQDADPADKNMPSRVTALQLPVEQDQIDLPHAISGLDNNQICLLGSQGWLATEYASLLGNEMPILELIAKQTPSAIYLPGAVTDSVLQKILPVLQKVKLILVKHPLHLHISKIALRSLSEKFQLMTLHSFQIMAIAVNSWSVTGSHLDSYLLRKQIRHTLPDYPVIDIYEA